MHPRDFQQINRAPMNWNDPNEKKPFIQNKNYQNHQYLIDLDILKQRFLQKLQDTGIKVNPDQEQSIYEQINNSFQTYMKNQIDKMIKISSIDNQQQYIINSQKQQINQNLILHQSNDSKKQLLQKKQIQQNNENSKFFIGKNKNFNTDFFKQLQVYDKMQQEKYEELCLQKNIFEEYEGKKKIKKTENDQDIYTILLKNKTEKTKEIDNLKKNTEDTSKAIDYYTGTDQVQVEKNFFAQEKLSDTQQNNILQVLNLKTVLFYLENEPLYKKSNVLFKAYLKSNIF